MPLRPPPLKKWHSHKCKSWYVSWEINCFGKIESFFKVLKVQTTDLFATLHYAYIVSHLLNNSF